MMTDQQEYDLTLGLDELDDSVEALTDSSMADGIQVIARPSTFSCDAVGQDQDSKRTEEQETLPARERIEHLFASMKPCEQLLLGIMRACRKPLAVGEVNRRIDAKSAMNPSAYTAANLCAMLERAGAIELLDQDGNPYREKGIAQEETPVTNKTAAETLEAASGQGNTSESQDAAPTKGLKTKTSEDTSAKAGGRMAYWSTTDAGLEALGSYNPLQKIELVFENEQKYLPVYKRILELVCEEGGAKTPLINHKVNTNKLLEHPRLFATHFISRLEDAGAVVWTGSWTATEAGVEALGMLNDVDELPEPDKDAPDPIYTTFDDWAPLEG